MKCMNEINEINEIYEWNKWNKWNDGVIYIQRISLERFEGVICIQRMPLERFKIAPSSGIIFCCLKFSVINCMTNWSKRQIGVKELFLEQTLS